jgi:CheY-like chemotaxis protein
MIDDHPGLLPDQVSHVFHAPARRVEIARTGAEGLQRVADVRLDVILLDLRLPDQSGLEVLRQLHQIDARIPVVPADAAIGASTSPGRSRTIRPRTSRPSI